LFDKRRGGTGNSESSSVIEVDTPFKINALATCGCYVAIAASGGHVTLYKFYPKNIDEELVDIPVSIILRIQHVCIFYLSIKIKLIKCFNWLILIFLLVDRDSG
jgi:hypothetical protein